MKKRLNQHIFENLVKKKLINPDCNQSIEEIIKENKDMEETFINEIDNNEQNLLAKYVESVKKFNKAYFANKAELLKQQRKSEGNSIDSLIEKIQNNYMKNPNNLAGDVKQEDDDYYQSEYDGKRNSRSRTPLNYRARRDTHMKTTNPSHSSNLQEYRKNKLQTSNSRIPFPIFDQNATTPHRGEGYDQVEYEEATPENHVNARVNEFSLGYSDHMSDSVEKHKRRASNKFYLPSERLRCIKESKAQLLEANEIAITVKITPSANEVSIKSKNVNIQNIKERKRQRKAKLGGYRYVNPGKHSYNYREENKGYESEKESSENNGYYRYEKKRHRKYMYKKSKESLMDTPPILSKLGNMDKRAHGQDYYDYKGYPFDPNGPYLVFPSSRMASYNIHPYYQENASPMVMKVDRKHMRDRYHQFYPQMIRFPPVGTCPG